MIPVHGLRCTETCSLEGHIRLVVYDDYERIFPLASVSRLALGIFSPAVKCGLVVTLTTHPT
jgi:hypothetical protein